MLQNLETLSREARSWPFEQARNLLAHVLKKRLSDAERDAAKLLIDAGKTDEALATFEALNRPVILETGYGPSGLPHMGTFGEVARTTMVRNAFRALTGDHWRTRLIAFSDDMDGLRKVPEGVPNPEMLREDLHLPLTKVRDPFGTHDSFGAHNNARLRAFLDSFGFDYEFMSSTETYRSGRFDATLLTLLERFDKVMGIMLPTLGEERRATYSPFLPVSPITGHVLQVPTLERNVERGTIVFDDPAGGRTEVPVTGGHVKLQWKPDWAMRWTALDVDYEMSGKDLIESVRESGKICRALGGTPPEGFNYELFLDVEGKKISKSKGNGLTMDEWLRYGTPESLSWYMFQSPKSAKSLHFNVIPRATDDYLSFIEQYKTQEPAKQIDNAVWHIHSGQPPQSASPVSFALLLNLVGVANASSKDQLWAYFAKYLPDATPENEPVLDRLMGYALNYYEDFVKPSKTYRLPDDKEKAALLDLAMRLKALPADTTDGEAIQGEVYAVGKAHEFEPLRAWFQALYEVLLGASQGPRFGSFAAIYGLPQTIALIEAGANGELAGV
ncbi:MULTISPECIES: lysine--tRNA ligase [unclassified Brevundimonas]|uniref:lysine--tRNA ligase n=1 Tax=unclassified Brevundimonas TaxID=2622653 RepID=UPI000CFD8CB6|nr:MULTISPECIES: lysine--tRNA ligase [unclassified Brevundimonas]PRA30892.1 lysine--tRNA ligase [Brevundimonas sp. MYb27]PQZ82850.1 lysine--tRNA ligase [Brevundimonas sp. MYb31]PRB16754.1 lysine--tRNA ligase [Brevundimonas sp. MYb52]PRB34709.1 lysine--tRNA ligase [Brevundimonas sp. MYb46]PRB54724.1 lysine--tRNA ligase [Brevundimonas sp. MYb33]